MSSPSLAAVLAAALAAPMATAAVGQSPSTPPMGLDSARYAALAKHLVVDGYGVRPGEKVVISGGAHTIPFIEAVAIEVLRAGGHPYTNLDTEAMMRYSHYDMPLEYLGRPPNRLDEALVTLSDIEIRAPATTDYPGLHGGMSPDRRAKENASEKAWDALNTRSKRRSIYVALPADGDTTGTGLTAAQWHDMWYRAAMADYGQMHDLGERVRRQLGSARQVKITSKEGTNLAFTLGKPPVVDAGPASADQARRGFAPRKHTFLPAGIVAIVPVEATVEGVVKVARDQCDSMVVDEVIEIRKGSPVRVEAATQQECVRQALTPKDRVGYVTIGLNPAITPSENNGAYFANDRGLGLVTVNFGDHRPFGGNSPGGEWYVVIAGATLEADGKAIVRDGRIVETEGRSASTSR